jgi:hypothetical protein
VARVDVTTIPIDVKIQPYEHIYHTGPPKPATGQLMKQAHMLLCCMLI